MGVNLSDAQFKELLATMGSGRNGTMSTCTASYNGEKDRETVEAFLTTLRVFKRIERINDTEALAGLPLVLHDEAAVWWQGVKGEITSWDKFESSIRGAFAPKKPEYLIYLEICGEKQEMQVPTDAFIRKKRMLFAELPREEQLKEKQQLDITYGLLKLSIRDKIPRENIKTYDDLLSQARGIEALIEEKAAKLAQHGNLGITPSLGTATTLPHKKSRCNFCKKLGHVSEECRKRKRIQETDEKSAEVTPENSKPALDVKFSCYGCGTPGVYRSNCTLCNNKRKKKMPENSASLGFCALNLSQAIQARPMVFLKVNGTEGKAYIDTCAKISVASYELYKIVKERGQTFNEEFVNVTLADGVPRRQKVLSFQALVELCGRTLRTTFVVLPESRDNRTLLGIGFLQRAGIILNIAQFTWHYIDNPDEQFELFQENFLMYPNQDKGLTWSYLSEPTVGAAPVNMKPTNPAHEFRPVQPAIAALPTESAGIASTEWNLIPIELPELPPKKSRTAVFDGYSPQMEFMMRDAVQNISESDCNLSPHSRALFEDIDLRAFDVATPLNQTQKKQHGPASYEIADPKEPSLSLGVHHASALKPYTGQNVDLPTPVLSLRKRGRPRKVQETNVAPTQQRKSRRRQRS